jgi:hypothetical protein
MASYTVFSDAGDATVRMSSGTFSTARDALTGLSVVNTATAYQSVGLEGGATYNFYIPFFMFDTSVVPSTETVASATLDFSLVGDNSGTASNQWCLTQTTQATWNSLITADYDQRGHLGSEGAARVTRKVSTETGYQTMTMNATGSGWIARNGETKPASASASGKTQLAVTYTADIDNSAPTTNDYNQLYFADQAGTTNDPKLSITTGVSNSGLLLMGCGI